MQDMSVDSISSIIEHLPWIGADYESGINHQKIAIMGFSHHSNEPDRESLTIDKVGQITSGQADHPYFHEIRNCLGYSSHAELWPKVMFFNFLPSCISSNDELRYGSGSPEQRELGKKRMLRLLATYKPNKLLIFTSKGWNLSPPTQEQQMGRDCIPLGPDFPNITYGTYDVGTHSVKAYGLLDLLIGNEAMIHKAVQHILALPV